MMFKHVVSILAHSFKLTDLQAYSKPNLIPCKLHIFQARNCRNTNLQLIKSSICKVQPTYQLFKKVQLSYLRLTPLVAINWVAQ